MANLQNTAAIISTLQQALDSLNTKPGYSKTEFWTTLGTALLGIGMSYAQATPYGLIASSVVTLGYTIARSVVTAKNDAGKASIIAQVSTNPSPLSTPGRM
jgi:hypothetical protein